MLIGAGLMLAALVILAASPVVLVVTIVYVAWSAIKANGRDIK